MDPYTIKIGGVIADPYRIAISYGLDSAIGEAAKKLLRCGRKHKDIKTDVQEAIKTLTRWLVIQDDIEREVMIESMRYAPTALDAEYPRRTPAHPPEAVPGGITHYTGPTQEQIAERNRQCASSASITGLDLAYPKKDVSHVVNPDYVDAEDDTVQVDLSKLSGDELTAAGFPEDGIVREAIRQAGLKTNMEKLLDERDGETNWP